MTNTKRIKLPLDQYVALTHFENHYDVMSAMIRLDVTFPLGAYRKDWAEMLRHLDDNYAILKPILDMTATEITEALANGYEVDTEYNTNGDD